jgi:hypothetical protein
MMAEDTIGCMGSYLWLGCRLRRTHQLLEGVHLGLTMNPDPGRGSPRTLLTVNSPLAIEAKRFAHYLHISPFIKYLYMQKHKYIKLSLVSPTYLCHLH